MKKHTNPKSQWYESPIDGWKTTTTLSEAILHYIGEVVITPKVSCNTIRQLLNLPVVEDTTVFYYGTPNTYLLRKFEYIKGHPTAEFVFHHTPTQTNPGRIYN